MERSQRRALDGLTVAVTRPAEESAGLTARLVSLGAEVIEAPTIAMAEVEDTGPLDRALAEIGEYDWLVLTSVGGLKAMLGRLSARGLGGGLPAGVKVAAIGPATAARLADHGILADLVPDEAVGESLAAALIERGVSGRRVLLLRSDLSRGELVEALARAGARCDDVVAYRTVRPASLPASFLERLDAGQVDWLTLTSPSCLRNLLALLGPTRAWMLHGVKVASIGPVTTRSIRAAGLLEAVEARPHDTEGLVAAIVRAVTGG